MGDEVQIFKQKYHKIAILNMKEYKFMKGESIHWVLPDVLF